MSGILRIDMDAVDPGMRRSIAVTLRDAKLRHVQTLLDVDEVELPPGMYQVEALLPSGESVHDVVQVVDGESVDAVLAGIPAPSEAGASIERVERGVLSASPTRRSAVVVPHAEMAPPRVVLGDGTPLPAVVVQLPGRGGDRWAVTVSTPLAAVAFLEVEQGAVRVRVALPLDGARRDSCEVLRAAGASSTAWDVSVRGDPSFTALASYLQQQALFRAQALAADEARRAMMGKLQDPLRAVLGAYALVRLEDTGSVRSWFENLAQFFPWLPDGAILHARLLDQEGKPHEARRWYLTAARRGLPLCGDGLSMLTAGLRRRLREADDAEVEDALAALLPAELGPSWDRLFTTVTVTNPA